ncbi:flavin reductase family protein [Nocardioides sp. Bht2]|uniref:flavin reductase family protein n=1 Tax=Nocardioides sp. Bht2 TaxID=3392297 RepID=UPI0039B40E97
MSAAALHLVDPEEPAATYVETDFRDAMGRFASGIVVVTAIVDNAPVGFTCQSFSSLSLMPALVLFCASRGSTSWQRMKGAEAFSINVLGESQQDVSAQFAQRNDDKFAGRRWQPGTNGAPHLAGALVHIDCRRYDVVAQGDHDIVVGQVEHTAVRTTGRPLLYFRGTYDTLAW